MRAEAQRAGVAVLAVPRELAWNQLHTVVRTAFARAPAAFQDGDGLPIGDLFALANAVAATLGGPVEIDDATMHLLAFSTSTTSSTTCGGRRSCRIIHRPSSWTGCAEQA